MFSFNIVLTFTIDIILMRATKKETDIANPIAPYNFDTGYILINSRELQRTIYFLYTDSFPVIINKLPTDPVATLID